jgi:hypothetical protein
MLYMVTYNTGVSKFEFSMDFFGKQDKIVETLKAYPGWSKCFDTAWIIATTDDIETVAKKLEPLFEKKDFWLVSALSEKICGGLSEESWKWIADCRAAGF